MKVPVQGSALQPIYSQPALYDLEHNDAHDDIVFFSELLASEKPLRILEVASGTGRLTIPLARMAKAWGGKVVGLELSTEMIAAAQQKPDGNLVEWVRGDMRSWHDFDAFDFVIATDASMSHLVTERDRLDAWNTIASNTRPGGIFAVAELMPDLERLAQAIGAESHEPSLIDANVSDSGAGLLRSRSEQYFPHEQRINEQYQYRTFETESLPRKLISTCDAHVYFPSEISLLFQVAGFDVEAMYGSFSCVPLNQDSSHLIVIGRRRPDLFDKFVVESCLFEESKWIPNNPKFPLLIYRRAFNENEENLPNLIENTFNACGWMATWRYKIFEFPHFHSNTHEVIGVYRGRASVRFGHTKGLETQIVAGDVVIIPAGVSHEALTSSSDFHAVGAYPAGFSPNIISQASDDLEVIQRQVESVPRPILDPVRGSTGPLFKYWSS